MARSDLAIGNLPFLASSFIETANLFKKKTGKTRGKKVIFIANASDTHKGKTWWVDDDRQSFKKLGCQVKNIDLRIISKKDLEKVLQESDIIHFCGGSVLYLINLLREKGFDKLIIDFVRKDRIIYTGTSAGSMIVAEDLKLSYYDPEETEYIDVKKMKDFSGLKFVNFLIIPHTNNKDFSKGNVEMVKYLSKFSQSLIFIYDNQAVWVEDDKFEILGN